MSGGQKYALCVGYDAHYFMNYANLLYILTNKVNAEVKYKKLNFKKIVKIKSSSDVHESRIFFIKKKIIKHCCYWPH